MLGPRLVLGLGALLLTARASNLEIFSGAGEDHEGKVTFFNSGGPICVLGRPTVLADGQVALNSTCPSVKEVELQVEVDALREEKSMLNATLLGRIATLQQENAAAYTTLRAALDALNQTVSDLASSPPPTLLTPVWVYDGVSLAQGASQSHDYSQFSRECTFTFWFKGTRNVTAADGTLLRTDEAATRRGIECYTNPRTASNYPNCWNYQDSCWREVHAREMAEWNRAELW